MDGDNQGELKMTQLNTFNQWAKYAQRKQLRIHSPSGVIRSNLGFNPGFDTGFASAAGSWYALARYARRGMIRVGPSLRRQIAARNL